ncbi:metallophosphoesterase family protein [Secundilactobacillus collinoides]|uniref:metallophosphoesterase family protein n=1 Tax=Secundilactobacillus collinoides TaxID=33960 RepID=UPI0006D0B40A|nr:metallophosphoesterase [Secundilactobacillus collinoides]
MIGLINDTHFDSYNTEASAGTLRDLKAVSYFAKNYGLDAIVANGDLNDGVQTLDRTILDISRAVTALKLSETPFFITQGNHDDNSGFARYENGYRVGQVLTSQAALNLRNQHHSAQQIMPKTSGPAFYGKYRVSNSQISLILLDTFDIPDSAVDGYFKRNYDEAPTGLQWTGILQNIRHSRSRIRQAQADWFSQTMATLAPEEQVIVFTHDSIRSAVTDDAVGGFWTYDWFANNQQGAYAQVSSTLAAHRNQVISVMNGHTHVDDWSHDDGINWITTTCDAPDRRKTGHGQRKTATNSAWDVLVINPTQRRLSRFRYGWRDAAGSESRLRFALFGDGTDNRVPGLHEKLNKLRPAALTRNAILYNQKSKQTRQRWRGFRSNFDY